MLYCWKFETNEFFCSLECSGKATIFSHNGKFLYLTDNDEKKITIIEEMNIFDFNHKPMSIELKDFKINCLSLSQDLSTLAVGCK
jgi:hypothetical protein